MKEQFQTREGGRSYTWNAFVCMSQRHPIFEERCVYSSKIIVVARDWRQTALRLRERETEHAELQMLFGKFLNFVPEVFMRLVLRQLCTGTTFPRCRVC
jgi:hypothetical protein